MTDNTNSHGAVVYPAILFLPRQNVPLQVVITGTALILERTEIALPPASLKILERSWSKDAIADSVVEKIVYRSDGLRVAGYLAYPRGAAGASYPCIIWNRGGAKQRGVIDEFTARGIYGRMASWGYVVLASSYRGSIAGEGEEEFGGSDVNDVCNLIPLADELPFADTARWGIEGWSRGGMMAWLTLRRESRFRCALFSGAISDVRGYAQKSPGFFNGFEARFQGKDIQQEMEKRSAITFAHELPGNTAYCILHGSADASVPVAQSYAMAARLHELGYTCRLVILENGDHYLRGHRREVDEIRRQWFNRFLQ